LGWHHAVHAKRGSQDVELRNKSTQNGRSEEMHGEENFRDATAYAKSITVGNWAKLFTFPGYLFVALTTKGLT
jgi:hypothetical protein